MKYSSVDSSIDLRERNLSSSNSNQEIKQNKRKEELIKSFSSSVNISIDTKQPTLPITIPTYLFSGQTIKTERIDDQSNDKIQKTPPKRDVNGSIKHETNTNAHDNSTTINDIQKKKSKTSHEYKQESIISPSTIRFKDEPTTIPTIVPSDKITTSNTTTTIVPMIVQPKKEKPTAKYVEKL